MANRHIVEETESDSDTVSDVTLPQEDSEATGTDVMLCNKVMLRGNFMQCYAMLCYVMLCHTMSYYVTL